MVVENARVVFAKGRTIWSSWALTLASCASGCVCVAVIAWSFPGPPIGPIALAVGLVLIVTASRLYVRIESDGLSVPRGLGREPIRRTDLSGLSVASGSQLGPTASMSTLIAHMADGSQRPIWLLTSFNALPGGLASLRKAADLLARNLEVPLT